MRAQAAAHRLLQDALCRHCPWRRRTHTLRTRFLRHQPLPVCHRCAVRCRAGPRADCQFAARGQCARDTGNRTQADSRRQCASIAEAVKDDAMKTQTIEVKLSDGVMGAYLAIPDRTPAGAVIAIMEIWGVNDTMRRHAHEFAEAGFVCLVPDLFWRQEPGVELSDHNPAHVHKAFDLYYDFDYDLAVQDVEDTRHFLEGLKIGRAHV